MKKLQLLLLGAVFFNIGFASIPSGKKKPSHKIVLKTVEGNSFRGLLLSVNDSSLVAYPGKWKEWRKGKKYRSVHFYYTRIEEVILKEKGRIAKGMVIGGVAGLLPVVASKTNGTREPAGNILLGTVPAGIIAGAVLAGKSGKRYWINGNIEQFRNFIRRLW